MVNSCNIGYPKGNNYVQCDTISLIIKLIQYLVHILI